MNRDDQRPTDNHEGVEISVVIAGNEATVPIGLCLQSLGPQCGASQEIIVAVGGSPETAAEARRICPQAIVLEIGRSASLAELRGRALQKATGNVVAVIDPYSIPAHDWVEAVLRSHRANPNIVIGGSVGLYREEHASLWDWSRYINEYGLFMPPVREGPTSILPGCNISYKRCAIPSTGPFWKTFVNDSFRAEGEDLLLDPSIRVLLFKPVSVRNYLLTRYHHGRCYAAMRSSSISLVERLFRAATAPIVPLVLHWRLVQAFWHKRRHRRKLLLTTPLQLLFYTNWMLGEVGGYLLGSGTSCLQLHH